MSNENRAEPPFIHNPPEVLPEEDGLQWYYLAGDKTFGPCVTSEIRQLITVGQLPSDTYVFREGMTDWARANTESHFRLTPPPLATISVSQSRQPRFSINDLKAWRRKLMPYLVGLMLLMAGTIVGVHQIWSAKLRSNTLSCWTQYKEIKGQDFAYFDLDLVNSRKKQRSAMWEVYSRSMDKDLKNLIGARIVLWDRNIELTVQAQSKLSALQNKATLRGFVGGMLGGLLNPGNPVAGGAVVGGIAASSVNDEASNLLDSVHSATRALKAEYEKLDAYELEVEKILRSRYKWQ